MNRACSSALVAAVLSAAAMVIGCGGAAPAPKSAPSYDAPPPGMPDAEAEPQTIEEAEAAIARARADLEPRATDALRASEPAPSADQEAPAPEPRQPQAAPTAQDTCASNCRAIASMRRAVRALCRMAGDDDTRCVEARATLAESEARLARCGC
jgi:hypothetical protein